MLKPVTLLALDEASAPFAAAVQQRAAAACGLDDLVQMRDVTATPLAEALASVHARRQAPESALRAREDISRRELVLLVASAAGSAKVLELAREVRSLYELRRFARLFSVEVLCLLPPLFGNDGYGGAYALLKSASGSPGRPFDAFWLLDSMNANGIQFGPLAQAEDAYAQAVAGALLLEPEMSGAPAGRRPRGMDPTFSSFGCAELFFPREIAAQRLEARLVAQLVREKLLADGGAQNAQLAAKQFITSEAFAVPLGRIGPDAGRTLFQRFQPRTAIAESTRTAEEVIAAMRHEVAAHRDTTHAQNLQTLHAQAEQTTSAFAKLLDRTIDESLDADSYAAAIAFAEALVDPLPDLHAPAGVAPRNLVTEIGTATAALDARLRFTPNTGASDAGRKRARELDELLAEQKPAGAVLDARNAPEQLAEMEQERDEIARRLPELLFAEETQNNAGRQAAREAEAARLAAETDGAEQRLRDLFVRRPRAEQALREALEARRAFLWRMILFCSFGVASIYGVPFAFGVLRANLERIHWTAIIAVVLFALYATIRYFTDIAPPIRLAREELERIRGLIDVTGRAIGAAHADEVQFEGDAAHRRATLRVLHDTRTAAAHALDALRARVVELEQFAQSQTAPSIRSDRLSISIIDDGDVDRWYDRTADDWKPAFREFFETCISRSQSRRAALDDVHRRVAAFASTVLQPFRKLGIAQAAQLADDASQRFRRLAEHSAPLVDIRDDDPEAQRTMQRDTTLWADTSDRTFADQLQRRFPEAQIKPPDDPLRVQVFTRILHYPAYVLGQLEFYRSQYDAAQHPESAALPDLLPSAPTAPSEETLQ